MNLNILLQILGVLLLEAIGITASMISCHVGNRMYEKEKEEQRKALLGNDGEEQAPLSEENPVAQPVINDLQNTDKTEISKARNKVNLAFALQLVGIWLGIFLAYSFVSLMIAVVTGYKPGQLFTFGIVCLQIFLTKVAVSRRKKRLAEIEKK